MPGHILNAPDNGIPHRGMSGQLHSQIPNRTVALQIATMLEYSTYNADGSSDKTGGFADQMIDPAQTVTVGGVTYTGKAAHIIGRYDKGVVENSVGDAPASMRTTPPETLLGGRNIMQPGKIVAPVNGYDRWDTWHAFMRSKVNQDAVNGRYATSDPYHCVFLDTMGPESTKGQQWWAGNSLGRPAGSVISDADWVVLENGANRAVQNALGATTYQTVNGIRASTMTGGAGEFSRLIQAADMGMWEGWGDYGLRNNSTTRPTDTQWRQQIKGALEAQQAGKDFHGLIYLSGGTVAAGGANLRGAQEWMVASLLLASNGSGGGHAILEIAIGGATDDPWVSGELLNPLYLSFRSGNSPTGTSRLGNPSDFYWDAPPTGAITTDGKLYQRAYQTGYVLLNTSHTRALTSTLDGRSYSDLFTGAAVGSSVTVQPGKARFLVTTQQQPSTVPVISTPVPVITGTPIVGEILHVSAGGWTGALPQTPAYQWLRDGVVIAGATLADYPLVAGDQTHNITARVTMNNSFGPSVPFVTAAVGPVGASGGATGPVWTTQPSISGTTFVGGLVTCDPGVVNVTGASTTAYQWERWSVDASTHVPITGAISQSYAPVDADVGSDLVCKVTVTDTVAPNFARTGAAGPVTGPPLPQSLTPPTISGSFVVGSSLLANPGGWSPSGLTFGYVWERGLPDGTWLTVATGRGYVPTTADVGNRLHVLVTASTTGGSARTAESAPSVPVLPFVGGVGSSDDLIGRRSSRPVLIDWLLALYTKEGHPLGPIIGARGRKWTVNLNGHDQLEFGVLLEHRQAPQIVPLERVVKLWRRVPGQPVSGSLPDFCGIIGPSDEDGEGDLAQFTAYSHDWLLEDRYVWEHLLNGLPFRQKDHDDDQAQILLNLLDYTNQRGATGIAEGTFTPTATRDREYDIGQNIWQAFTDITQTLGGVDIVPEYIHQDGSPFHLRMGFQPVRGTYLQNLRLDYRSGQRNLANLRRRRVVEAGQAPHNFVGIKGQGDAHAAPFAARFDDPAINRFGLREKYVEESNIQTVRALVAIAQSYVDAEKVIPEVYEATLSPAKPPYYGQFHVGDGVHLAGSRGSLVVDKDQRIYQAIITVSDDTGLETTAITVGDDVDGLVVP